MNMVAEAPVAEAIHSKAVAAVYSTLKSVFKNVKYDFKAEGDFANYVFTRVTVIFTLKTPQNHYRAALS